MLKGILLAAGRGERLRPLTDEVAKPALDVGGAPLGAYGARLLAELGGRLAVNVSWLAEKTQATLRPFAPPDTLWFVESLGPLGTAGTVAALLPQLAPTFATANGDSITDLSAADLMATHERVGAAATLAVQRVHTGADLELKGERALRLIDRHAEPAEAGARYIGVGIFERDRISTLLDPLEALGLAEAVFVPLAARNELAVHVHSGFALDVGTPERLEEARRLPELEPPARWVIDDVERT